MDFSTLPNPYDFANPVDNPDLFAGRTSELENIRYYLDHAKKAPRAINLALIGERASGKTSLLNMIEHESSKRGFCVVRIELDEGDGESQLQFFYKIFDAVLTTACFDGAYSGEFGKTYETYRDMVDAYDIPDDKTFCSFVFPMQYAKAMGAGQTTTALSDTAFKRDLKHIYGTLQKPIIILMDECDILGRSRVHLEKLRNIFMNTPGYMLVLTGTERLFPLINEVFSPIIRQFKKINVIPFDEKDDTRSCIDKPLESIGLDPSDLVDFDTIHNLSSGRPYEIQLICHFLFRRIQQGKATTMELTIDVLDDVLEELQALQDTSDQKFINEIRSLDKKQLDAVGILCSSSGKATFEQVWFSEYLLNGHDNWTQEELREMLNILIGKNIIHVEDSWLNFSGDVFDRIYCKYYSRKHGVNLHISDIPPDLLTSLMLGDFVSNQLDCLQTSHLIHTGVLSVEVQEVYSLFLLENDANTKAIKNPFDSYPGVAKYLYEINLDHLDCSHFQILELTLTTPWYQIRRWYSFEPNYCSYETCEKDVENALAIVKNRIIELNGKLDYIIHTFPVLPSDNISRKILSSRNEEIKREIFNYHIMNMVDEYIENENINHALTHAELAYLYNDKPAYSSVANNLGYIFLAAKELDKARENFVYAIEISKQPDESAIAKYNLGISYALSEDWTLALDQWVDGKIDAENITEEDQSCMCLFIPVYENNQVEISEVDGPHLLNTINKAINVAKALIEQPPNP